MKQMLRSIAYKNIYILDKVQRIRGWKDTRNYYQMMEAIEGIDPILDFDYFADEVKRVLYSHKKGERYQLQSFGREALLYGHLRAFYNYAGIAYSEKDSMIFPLVEHGVNPYVSPPDSLLVNSIPCCIYSGSYKKKMVHRLNRIKPVFDVGVYIHYAKNVYSKEKQIFIKKKYGKILLVFPVHAMEITTVTYDYKWFVKYVMEFVAKDYDTVFISTYWNDINDPVYKEFQKYGAILVSNGFRGDPDFINRQRTLFELADATCGNGFGTNIGYSIYFKKPHLNIRMDDLQDVEDKRRTFSRSEKENYKKMQMLVDKAFHSFDCTVDARRLQKRLYEKFWGGDSIRSCTEMKGILQLGKMIFKYTYGFPHRLDSVVADMLNGKIEIESEMYRILHMSLID